MRGYQPACVLGAAAELNLFTLLGDGAAPPGNWPPRPPPTPRATAMLLDALAALGLLEKTGAALRDARRTAAAVDRPTARRPSCRWSGTA